MITPARPGAPGPGDFTEAVEAVIQAIPPGAVLSYGEVAAEAGFPGAAKAVGNLLARADASLPWWRVVTASGRLVPGHETGHARRLRGERVELDPALGRVRMTGAARRSRDPPR